MRIQHPGGPAGDTKRATVSDLRCDTTTATAHQYVEDLVHSVFLERELEILFSGYTRLTFSREGSN